MGAAVLTGYGTFGQSRGLVIIIIEFVNCAVICSRETNEFSFRQMFILTRSNFTKSDLRYVNTIIAAICAKVMILSITVIVTSCVRSFQAIMFPTIT